MNSKSLKKLLIVTIALAAGLVTAGCGLDQKGIVLFTDPSYRASVVGTDRDGFTVPDGILWSQGRFLIADEGGNAFRIWNGPGHVTTLCDSKIGVMSPEDMAVDAVGNIYFTDDDAGGVWKIPSLGEPTRLVDKDKGLISTEGIVLTPAGNLLVGDGEAHKIFTVTPDGGVSEFLGSDFGISKAESMAFDEKGNLFIADNEENILYLLTPDKKLHRLIANREGFSPETIWYSRGILYITDSKDGKLFRYTPEDGLNVIAVFGGQLHAVNGITTDDDGVIYVSIQTDLKKKIGYLLKIEHDLR